MKTCFKCRKIKPLSDYYRHPKTADGHLNKCKECPKEDMRRHRRESNAPREYDKRRYYFNPEVKERIQANAENWRDNNPKARAAHNAVARAKANGTLIVQPCEVCGDDYNIHAHHDDYDNPLSVRWLCPLHHVRHHHD